MDRKKMSSKDCSEVNNIKLKFKLNGVSTLQENKILHDSNSAKFCQQNHMNILASSENNQSFYSIVDFCRLFYNVKRTKRFTSRGKVQRFVAPDRSKMVSLQDSFDVPVNLFPPLLHVLLFLPLSVT